TALSSKTAALTLVVTVDGIANTVGCTATATKTFQLNLEQQAGIQFFIIGQVVLMHHLNTPATVVVFNPGQGADRAVQLGVPHPAANGTEPVGYREDGADIGLFNSVGAAVGMAESGQVPVIFGVEYQLATARAGTLRIGVPYPGAADFKVIQRRQHHFTRQRRVTAVRRTLPEQAYIPVIKITHLANADPGPFGPGEQIIETAGQRHGQLVGIPYPVAAGKTVPLEQLIKPEALQTGVKIRDLVLVFIRISPGIVQPGFQGLIVGNIKQARAAIEI